MATGGVGGFGTDYSYGAGVISPASPLSPTIYGGTVGGIGNTADQQYANAALYGSNGYNSFPDPDSPYITIPNADGTGVTTGTVQPGGTISPTPPGAFGAIAAFLSEMFLRAGVVTLGLLLVLIALFFMFASAAIHEFKASGAPPVIPV